ncbi:CC0125/CC1285 family lipoprotein [Paraglaciecola aestuariivivens]
MRYLSATFITFCVFLLGCASSQPTAYQQAMGDNEFGYTETRLTDSVYRIDFVGNRHSDEARIKDYAMLRAAELTLQKGHDWFVILDSDTKREVKSRPSTTVQASTQDRVVQKCGLLGCSTYVSPGYTGVAIETQKVDGKVSTRLQISMGSGEAQNPSTAFDAKQLAENMRKNLE